MESTVICPDCGGVIGPVPEGHKPCVCDVAQPGPRPGMPDPAPRVKVCCQCGKDLSGKKRFHDSLGYWCEACHYSEKSQAKKGHTPCDACGRYVQDHKLIEFDDENICSRCFREKNSRKSVRRPVVFGYEHRAQQKRTLLAMASIAVVLLLIIVLSSMGVL